MQVFRASILERRCFSRTNLPTHFVAPARTHSDDCDLNAQYPAQNEFWRFLIKCQTQKPSSTLPSDDGQMRLHWAFMCFSCFEKDVRRMSWFSSDLQAVHCLFTSTAAVHASVR